MKYTTRQSTLVKGCLLMTTLMVFQTGICLWSASAQKKVQGVSMTNREAPFALQLKVVDRHQLQAVLQNRSHAEQTFLYNSDLQPIELVLMDATGKPIRCFDSRSTMKFDNTVYRAMYKKLAAGKEELLQTERITAKNNFSTLQWRPYEFEHIAPGTYKAHLVWKSSHDCWTDSETSKNGSIKDIWKGTVESKPVIIKIPGA